MQVLNPRSTRNPKGWREPYAEFQKLQALGRRLGEPAHSWYLEYPTSIKERISGNWILHYTLNCTAYSAHIGYDSNDSVRGLKEIFKSYPRHERTSTNSNSDKPKSKGLLIFDPHKVQQLFDEWRSAVTKVGHSMTEEEFHTKYKHHSWMLRRKAGWLEMTMRTYLTNHPHAQYWPSPPRDREEFDRRNRELERIVREKESRTRTYRDEHPEEFNTAAWKQNFNRALQERIRGYEKPKPETPQVL